MDVWKNKAVYHATMSGIRHCNLVLETIRYRKVCLGYKDDKRYYDGHSVYSLAIGHHRIPVVLIPNE